MHRVHTVRHMGQITRSRCGQEVTSEAEEVPRFRTLEEVAGESLRGVMPSGKGVETGRYVGTVLASRGADALEHRLDGLNHTSQPERTESSELASGGLILWRLSTIGQPELWCLVFDLPEGFSFVLEDDPEGNQPPSSSRRRRRIRPRVSNSSFTS